MVAGDKQLEGRREVEEILSHEPRGDFVSACQCFDFGFIPAPALLCFLRHDKASAAQLSEICRVPLAAGGVESPRIGDRGIIAEYCCDRINEGGLTIGPSAVGEDELVLACVARAGIAEITL